MPSNRGNSVGIKPSVGLTSRYLVVPISLHQDTVGPIAHTVRDAATVLSVIAGPDEHDNYTSAIPNNGVLPDYVAATKKPANLTGVRIGVPRNGMLESITFAPINASYIGSEFDKALDVLRSLGAEVVDPANFSTETAFQFARGFSNNGSSPRLKSSNETLTVDSDFISDMAAYFAALTFNPNNLHTVADLRGFTVSDPREDYPDRDVGVWDESLALGFNSSDVRAYDALQADLALDKTGGVTGTIARLGLDALVIPTDYAPTWAAAPGLPEVTVPLGAYPPGTPVIAGARELVAVAPGIPFGMTFLGKKWSEETLITLAHAFEQATHHRDAIVPGERATIPKTGLADVVGGGNGSLPAPTGTSSSGPPIATSGATRLVLPLWCGCFVSLSVVIAALL